MHTMLEPFDMRIAGRTGYSGWQGRDRPDLRERDFRDLLYGGLGPAEFERLTKLETGLWYTAVYFEYEDPHIEGEASYSYQQENRRLLEAGRCLEARIHPRRLCYIANHGGSSFVMILSSEGEETYRLRPLLEDFGRALSPRLPETGIGMSESSQRLHDIRQLFRQAERRARTGKKQAETRMAEGESNREGHGGANGRHIKIVAGIRTYIEQNAASIENVDQVAGMFYLSSRYANQLFKHYTGKTIFDCMIESRLEAAKKLLTAPKAKVYEVSEQIGYQNHSYFSSLFKQSTGLTPKQYIERYGRIS